MLLFFISLSLIMRTEAKTIMDADDINSYYLEKINKELSSEDRKRIEDLNEKYQSL